MSDKASCVFWPRVWNHKLFDGERAGPMNNTSLADSEPDAAQSVENGNSDESDHHSASNAEKAGEVHIEQGVQDLWGSTLGLLEEKLDPHIFRAYISSLSLLSFDFVSGKARVSAPSSFVQKHVAREYLLIIEQTLGECSGLNSVKAHIVVSQEEKRVRDRDDIQEPYVIVKKVKPTAPASSPAQSACSGARPLNPRYTFDSYVVGNYNQFCHAAAMRVGEEPGRNYNPLFIYGGVGLGKTHLLHAIGNSVLSIRPQTKVLYISSEMFTNELIQSLRQGTMDAFKNKYRQIEVLLIDDIQFMAGKERTQEEFFHTFNALYQAEHQIVLTSDKLPSEIPGIEERLRARFAWGLTADLQLPDFETRVAILNRKASVEGFHLPEDVAHFISENISSNVRELEGALTRLHAMSSIQKQPIAIEMAKSALQHLIKPKAVHISINDIKTTVALHFGIKVSDLVSKRRTRNLSFPRHIAMYLCRKHTTASFPDIGGEFGGRDHSSVIHAANVVMSKLKEDPEVEKHIETIEKKLTGLIL